MARVTADRVRVGVIGAGSMGLNHIRVYGSLREVDLIGAADPADAARSAVTDRYRIPAMADYRQLLGRVDAVTVAVPTALHHSVAIECIKAGVHILVEKPIADSSAHAEAMIAAARERGVVLQVGHVERFNPAVGEVTRLLAEDRVLAIAARRLSPPTPRIVDVDVVFDLMIHDIDIALSLGKARFAELTALGRPAPPALLDHVVAQGRLENGVIVSLTASRITQETIRQLEVTTERAYIAVNYLNRDITVSQSAAVTERVARGYSYDERASLIRPHVPTVEPLQRELEHFIECVRSGAEPLTSGPAGLEALRVAEQVAGSAAAA